jgi:serine/threonine-protein kinase
LTAVTPATPFSEGEVLAGKYRVERVLGSGGMGYVVAARHLQLGTGVAIKFLRPEACTDAMTVARFLREARAAARLQSEHVARVIDVATLDSGAPYIVMELLRGEDLAQALARGGPLPVERAAQTMLEACEAVAEAHSLGIIHRDLKPANLFLATRADGSPYVKVLDFGISKTLPTSEGVVSAGAATATGALFGTPYYMSPEQIRSVRAVDARTDVWSLGATLYELLTGRKPFEAASVPAVFVVISSEPPAPPRAHRPDLPVALEAVVLACLEKDPARRVPSVAELARRLAPFAPSGSASLVERVQRLAQGRATGAAVASVPPAAPGGPVDKTVQAATGRAWSAPPASPARSRLAISVAIGGSVLVVLAVASAVAVPRMRERRSSGNATATATATATGSATATATATGSATATVSATALASATATAPASAPASASSSLHRPPPPPGRKKDESSPTVE